MEESTYIESITDVLKNHKEVILAQICLDQLREEHTEEKSLQPVRRALERLNEAESALERSIKIMVKDTRSYIQTPEERL